MARFKKGQTVRVTSGREKGTVGTYQGNGDVYTDGLGNLAGVSDRILEDASGAQHCGPGGQAIKDLRPGVKKWFKAISGSDADVERYRAETFTNRNAQGQPLPENKGIARLVFGKYGERSRNGI